MRAPAISQRRLPRLVSGMPAPPTAKKSGDPIMHSTEVNEGIISHVHSIRQGRTKEGAQKQSNEFDIKSGTRRRSRRRHICLRIRRARARVPVGR